MEGLNNLFDAFEGEPIKPPSSYNLEVKISQSEDKKTNIFSYSFEFPTNYNYYEYMQKEFILQKHFDSNID